jgi:hypothetical protein
MYIWKTKELVKDFKKGPLPENEQEKNFRICLKLSIVAQALATLWFVLSPETVSQSLIEAQRVDYSQFHELIDKIILPLWYSQAILAVLLWKPTYYLSWLYLIVTISLTIIGAFSAASVLSAIDTMIGSIQGWLLGR